MKADYEAEKQAEWEATMKAKSETGPDEVVAEPCKVDQPTEAEKTTGAGSSWGCCTCFVSADPLPGSGHTGAPESDGNGLADGNTPPDEYYDCTENLESGPKENINPSTKEADQGQDRGAVQQIVTAEGPLGPLCPYFNAKLADEAESYTLDDLIAEVNGIVLEIAFEWLLTLRPNARAIIPLINLDDGGSCSHICKWTKKFDVPRCAVCHFWKPIYVMTCSKCGTTKCICCKFLQEE